MPSLIVNAVAEWNGKALKRAGKDVSFFQKQVMGLGKTIGGVFAAQEIIRFGQESVKAFANNQTSAIKLSKAVDNLGLSLSNPDITNFVKTLSDQSGIIELQLRPALQGLLTTTGDVAKSQQILTAAIDVSRGSSIDLATTAYDLSQAYVGNYKGLKKYQLGISNAQLKTIGFTGVMAALNKQFSGASASYLQSFAGQMTLFGKAVDDAKIKIGGGLVDSFAMLSGGTGIEGAIKSLNDVASSINAITTAIGALGAAVHFAYKVFDFIGNVGGLVPALVGPTSYIARVQAQVKLQDAMGNKGYGSSTGTMADYAYSKKEKQSSAAKLAADAKNLAIQKSLAKVSASKLATDKQSALTAKQSMLFNQNAISEVAALKGNLSDEERKKVELMLALEVGNTDQAAILSQQVASAYDATGQLALFLRTLPEAKNPFAAWDSYLNGIASKAASVATMGPVSNFTPTTNYPVNPNKPGDPNFIGPVIPSTNVPVDDPMISYNTSTGLNYNANAKGQGITQNFAVTVNNPVGNGIVDMVQQAVLDAGRLGHNLVPAGSL